MEFSHCKNFVFNLFQNKSHIFYFVFIKEFCLNCNDFDKLVFMFFFCLSDVS